MTSTGPIPTFGRVSGPPPIPQVDGPVRIHVRAHDPFVREALSASFAHTRETTLVAEVADADVVIVDAGPDAGATSAIVPVIPNVVLLEADADARSVLAAGARGVLVRRVDAPRLVAAVLAVHRGLLVVDGVYDDVFGVAIQTSDAEPLTTREREVLELMSAGLSNRRIARDLGITEHTAKFHVQAILAKLGARSRTEAVVRAARSGLVYL